MAGFTWEVRPGKRIVSGGSGPGNGILDDAEQPDGDDFDAENLLAAITQELERLRALGINIDLARVLGDRAACALRRAEILRRRKARLIGEIDTLKSALRDDPDYGERSLRRSGTWDTTMPTVELDPVATLTRYPEIIPGVFAQRRRSQEDPQAPPQVSAVGHVCFILDVSGSMATGVSPTEPIDVYGIKADGEPVQKFASSLEHEGKIFFSGLRPLLGSASSGCFPQWFFKKAGTNEEIPYENVRRRIEVQGEVVLAILQQVREKGHTVSVWAYTGNAFPVFGPQLDDDLRDYDRCELAVMAMEPLDNTHVAGALRGAADELDKITGAQQMTVICTDAYAADVRPMLPGRAGGDAFRQLIDAGPVFIMLLAPEAKELPGLEEWRQKMIEAYGANLEIRWFPDVSTMDAVFAAARYANAVLSPEEG